MLANVDLKSNLLPKLSKGILCKSKLTRKISTKFSSKFEFVLFLFYAMKWIDMKVIGEIRKKIVGQSMR